MAGTKNCNGCGIRLNKSNSADASRSGYAHVCNKCFHEAGLENEHADGHHDDEPNTNCPMCEANEVKFAEVEATEVDVPEADEVETPCFCGCGISRTPGSLYRPGHDAKHVSNLLTFYRNRVDLTSKTHEADVANSHLRDLVMRDIKHSSRLQLKLGRAIYRIHGL